MKHQFTRGRMERALRWLAMLAVLVLCSGCSTVVGHKLAKGRPGAYPGTKLNSHFISDAGEMPEESPVPGALFVTYGVLDFPLSLVADTDLSAV